MYLVLHKSVAVIIINNLLLLFAFANKNFNYLASDILIAINRYSNLKLDKKIYLCILY